MGTSITLLEIELGYWHVFESSFVNQGLPPTLTSNFQNICLSLTWPHAFECYVAEEVASKAYEQLYTKKQRRSAMVNKILEGVMTEKNIF